MEKRNLLGHKIGRLTVISEAPNQRTSSGISKPAWVCLCACGTELTVRSDYLLSETTKSCGCFRDDSRKETTKTHGMTETRTYKCYCGMVDRCYNNHAANFNHYGGRGITICDRWRERNGFTNFLADMGECPDGMSIERRDNNKGYSPDNCMWADNLQQRRNQRHSKWWFVNGVRYESANHAASVFSVCQATIQHWCDGYMKRGKYHPPRPDCWSEAKY